uniref:ATP-dependent RNA helicase n=1 Tax=Aureoumbra lagunensis TaxID=44058 RepID=A0A7S3JYY0_9STRA|mmetsp:Transcript_8601/g.13214  ORF Transcript_8601/g.13214 Transcript_8601/m.13214 type:complete len:650 (+) Transcript_8601:69-2018(+)|eukprot:CAMPEP_0197317416 /NCGR_PEP_ID=MMETSP0891-20130614/46947_1 /TAXON_ID=44058 ORGANISM="Aureoumbra lagunensis, Strain CCMP1510" /NCGR_SAMPLE_ID=MMETSP0891 /ASSEMBLY_ACC=CAM_ASM_000534 /LENGTH=649 /DNA_ID=CAMNT_0042807401 /DNA_START=30 /DNA_END=1979 /DNA_ORIENTATION=+
MDWDRFEWSAIEASSEIGDGCDDAAFLGLEEISGDAYYNSSKTKKKRKKIEEEIKVSFVEEKKKKKKKKKNVEKIEEKKEDEILHDDMTAWPVLNPILLRGLSRLGFIVPTEVQKAVIPAALIRGRDVACAAETGSGKTLAYALPVLEDIIHMRGEQIYEKVSASSLRALIIAPTRELALQVTEHTRAVLPESCVDIVACVVGGLSDLKQIRILSKNQPPILVATPGRLWDLSQSVDYVAEAFNDDTALRFLIIDEVDKLLEVGAFPQLKNLANKMQQLKTQQGRWQTMVFSATLGLDPPQQSKINIPRSLTDFAEPLRSPRRRKLELFDLSSSLHPHHISSEQHDLSLQNAEQPKICPKLPSNLKLQYIRVPTPAVKLGALIALLQTQKTKCLVFTNAVKSVQRVCLALELVQVEANGLHSKMSQRSRLRALDRFRKSQQSGTLIATDVAARGLDLPDLELVIHYDLPPDPRVFVHRSGRVARAGRQGIAISLVSAMDLSDHKRILAATGGAQSALKLDTRLLDAASRRAGLALDIAKAKTVQDRSKASNAWLANITQGYDDELTNDIQDTKQNDDISPTISARALSQKRAQLDILLTQPLMSRPKRNFVVVDANTIAHLAASSSSLHAPIISPPVSSSSRHHRKLKK